MSDRSPSRSLVQAGPRSRIAVLAVSLVAALVAGLLTWAPWHSGTTGAASPGADKDDAPAGAEAAMREARETDEEVVVETETTESSLTYALPDGTWRTESHAVPVRAQRPDGSWAPVDARLRSVGDGGRLRPANTPGAVEFAGKAAAERGAGGTGPATASAGEGTGPAVAAVWRPTASRGEARKVAEAEVPETFLASARYEGHTITYSWPGELPDPVVEGNRALYREVLPGVDLLLVAREVGGFGQLLIVKDEEAARQEALRAVSYGLASDTAEFALDAETGGVTITAADTGDVVGAIPTPFAWDSDGLESPEDPEAEPYTDTTTARNTLALTGLTGPEPGSATAVLPARLDGEGTGSATLTLDAEATGLLTGDLVERGEVRFPVFLDPTVERTEKGWTMAYRPYPNSNFYNGTNFGGGTDEARVGYETQTGGLARSYWKMNFGGGIAGSKILSASWKIKNVHSWSCEKRQIELWQTGSISTSTTWNNKPSKKRELDAKSFAHGYGSACPDAYVSYDAKSGAQDAADGGWTYLTLGLEATTETSKYTWRKFDANSAVLTVHYNRAPEQPVKGTISNGSCDTVIGEEVVGLTDIVMSATATDLDSNLKGLRFRLWETGASTKILDKVVTGTGGSKTQTASVTVPASRLADGKTYSWDIRSEDTEGAVSTYFPDGPDPCRFTVDDTAPAAPTLTSSDYPEVNDEGSNWAVDAPHGTTGTVVLDSSASATRYAIAFNGINYTYIHLDDPGNGQTFRVDRNAVSGHLVESVTRAAKGEPVTITLRAPTAGPTYIHAYAFDAVGNRSVRGQIRTFIPAGSTDDGPGDVTGDAQPDLVVIKGDGSLYTYPGEVGGEVYGGLYASYDGTGRQTPPGHWYDPDATATSKKHALISKWGDLHPGDGLTDILARTPDGGLWIYPGDGYGSTDTDQRVRVLLPDNAPDPATWDEMRTAGDVTGNGEGDLMIVTDAGELWFLGGYTAGAYTDAVRLLGGGTWAGRDLISLVDVDLDGTADLLWRNPDNGNMYIRHGEPVAGGEGLDPMSLALAVNSREGKDTLYGTHWTAENVDRVVSIPDTSGDGIPDLWARETDTGNIRVYHPSKTDTEEMVKIVMTADWGDYLDLT
ncbi:DNRLRE domain-containing protein [Streptomyces sp. ZYX-F-203]